jgi:hypothetical protein
MVYIRSDQNRAWFSHVATYTGSLFHTWMKPSETDDDDDHNNNNNNNHNHNHNHYSQKLYTLCFLLHSAWPPGVHVNQRHVSITSNNYRVFFTTAFIWKEELNDSMEYTEAVGVLSDPLRHRHQPDNTGIPPFNEGDKDWRRRLSAMEDKILFRIVKKFVNWVIFQTHLVILISIVLF